MTVSNSNCNFNYCLLINRNTIRSYNVLYNIKIIMLKLLFHLFYIIIILFELLAKIIIKNYKTLLVVPCNLKWYHIYLYTVR